ncbi:MAG: amino acid adenylation domain-containing protein, partial [Anaerolineae bacterium]
DVPFEILVDALQPERNLSHTPLFQVMFVLDNTPFAGADLPELTLRSLETETGAATFDLTMTMRGSNGELSGYIEYNTDLFNRETMQRFIGHFQMLLDGIVADPERPITEIPLLTPAERQQMLIDWNDTATPYPDNTTIHALIEAHAAARPDVTAVTLDGHDLSYGRLNGRANRLAHHLIDCGVQVGDIIGIATHRTPDMVIAILATLKAGAAYLPLDPTYPPERLNFMIADAQPKAILSHSSVIGDRLSVIGNQLSVIGDPLTINNQQSTINTSAPSPFTLRQTPDRLIHPAADSGQAHSPFMLLDSIWDTITHHPTTNPSLPQSPDSLAYLIYTSGSTGKPKGALLRHRGLCNLTDVQRRNFNIRAGESRILQFSPLSFDASVWETFMALRNGATLVLADQETLASGHELVRLLQRERITTVTLPPSLLAVMPEEDLPHLETVIAAGEACPAELVQRWAPGRTFFNAYGPTETTVCAAMYRAHPADPLPPPIGKPNPNFQLFIVDAHLNPLPIGVPGELLIGGVGLAQGYLNRPQLTAEKFIDFSNDALGIRNYEKDSSFILRPSSFILYKTGDLCRFRPDGNVEFLGRIDHQVKVRGFRIELGEIEAVLRTREDLQDVIVVADGQSPDTMRLVAYLVPDQQPGPSDSELRRHLRRTLPEYMVPSLFVMLAEMPLTPSNKIDRKALPAPDQTRPDLEKVYVAPRNEVEEKLAAICAHLLQVARVGVFDNFFELGGHSLLATQFISRVRSEFDIEMPLRTLFESPTVADFAVALEMAKVTAPPPQAPTIQRVSRAGRRMKRTDIGKEGNGAVRSGMPVNGRSHQPKSHK